ncbi:MAG: serine acetyltransferase [Clostridiales bacterium]|nr:serine acetyltransferase [Clostridiales bacterium]
MSTDMESKIKGIVDYIVVDAEQEHRLKNLSIHLQPDKRVIIGILEKLQSILFPAHFGSKKVSEFAVKYELGGLVEEVYSDLTDQITLALLHSEEYADLPKRERKQVAAGMTEQFLDTLPRLRDYLKMDIQAGFEGDPAAFNTDEIIFSYPGFYAIMVNRLAHELHLLKVPLIPRIMTEHAHGQTGIDIHPGATIGRYFFIDHGTGVVIGETTTIGDRVKIYQGVTLGGLSTRAGQCLRNVKRHPTIEDDVTIYSNASILGGETVIGKGCVIGGNAFITQSVPPHTRVSIRNPELLYKPDEFCVTDQSEYWTYEI